MANPIDKKLWTSRTVEETREIYADWASGYDGDMARMSYATPGRIAAALAGHGGDKAAPVLDFGCGTGLSGLALREAGFETVDGTDISPEMLEVARARRYDTGPLYRETWLGAPGEIGVRPGYYGAIVATGVISLGAAPPEMLDAALEALAPGALLAFSYNDPTLREEAYLHALSGALEDGCAAQLFRAHGPHLSETVTGSDVIVLRRL